ncbi:MAG: hypothetical protein R2864_00050 [Syntrophotaleaceae bacterium]
MLVNYGIGTALSECLQATEKGLKASHHTVLLLGISANLGLLGYFKYADFFISTTNNLSGSTFSLLNLVLPLAISFFTFQQIAYLVDSYRNETREYDFLNYCLL